MSYAWLSQVEYETKGIGATATAQSTIDGKAYSIQALKFVTHRIDTICQQEFEPRIETRYYDATRDNIDWYYNSVNLDRPLLSATTVKVGNTTLTQWNGNYDDINSADYYLSPRARSPYFALQGTKAFLPWNPLYYLPSLYLPQVYLQSISVLGVWGYREFYPSQGWVASGDSVQNVSGIDATTTSITVTSVNGAFYDGTSPRFSPGMLLQIESEWMALENTNANTNILTVLRGVRGSTAASHSKDTPISVWIPEPNINRAALRWVAYLYHRRAVYEKVSVETPTGIASQFPQDVPEEIAHILREYTFSMPVRV